jgi:hypothetical protein
VFPVWGVLDILSKNIVAFVLVPFYIAILAAVLGSTADANLCVSTGYHIRFVGLDVRFRRIKSLKAFSDLERRSGASVISRKPFLLFFLV